jgi:hypothetical protein
MPVFVLTRQARETYGSGQCRHHHQLLLLRTPNAGSTTLLSR